MTNHTEQETINLQAALVDIFRFENGKIVEHWDGVPPIPAVSRNRNGSV